MRLSQLRAKAADLLGKMQAISEIAAKENRARTDDERSTFVSLETEHTALCAEIADEERLQAKLRAAQPNVQDANQAVAAASAAAAGIEVGQDRSLDPKQPGFFGRQLHAIRRAALAMRGGDSLSATDLSLLKPMMAGPTGANTDVPSDGGFLVGQERSSTVLQRAYETGAVLSRVNRMPIGAGFNGAKFPAIDETSRADSSRFGGIVSGWLGQGNTLTAGKPKFREIDLKLRKVGAFLYSTDELNADAVAFESWVSRNLPLELQFKVEDAIVNGVGGNQPLGLLQSPAVITVTRSIASHVIADDLRAMHARLWAPLRSSSVFLVEQSVEPELDSLAVAIGTAGVMDPSYKAAGSVAGQKYATYKGIPIIPVEYCAALGTSGDIILASLPEYLLIDKGAVDQAVSLHVAFLTDEAVYRFMYRVDGQLAWNSALTPKSGGSTLSPVVILS